MSHIISDSSPNRASSFHRRRRPTPVDLFRPADPRDCRVVEALRCAGYQVVFQLWPSKLFGSRRWIVPEQAQRGRR